MEFLRLRYTFQSFLYLILLEMFIRFFISFFISAFIYGSLELEQIVLNGTCFTTLVLIASLRSTGYLQPLDISVNKNFFVRNLIADDTAKYLVNYAEELNHCNQLIYTYVSNVKPLGAEWMIYKLV